MYSPNQLILNTGTSDGDGMIVFEDPIDLPGGSRSTYAISAADFDGDGFVDLIFGNFGQPNQLLMNSGGTIGDGATFDTVLSLPAAGISLTYAVAAGDVDGDGFVDLIIGNWNEPNQLYMNGGTTDENGTPVVRGLHYFPSTSNTNIVSIAIADMNDDGHNDLIFGNVDQGNQMFINIGDGISYREPAGTGSLWIPG